MPAKFIEFLNAFVDHAQDPTSSIITVSAVDVVPVSIAPLVAIGPVCFSQNDDLEILTLKPQSQFIKTLKRHLSCIPVKTS